MKSRISIAGKMYLSTREAALIAKYTTDYVGQLCREGKLEATHIGRSWFVTEESLMAHISPQQVMSSLDITSTFSALESVEKKSVQEVPFFDEKKNSIFSAKESRTSTPVSHSKNLSLLRFASVYPVALFFVCSLALMPSGSDLATHVSTPNEASIFSSVELFFSHVFSFFTETDSSNQKRKIALSEKEVPKETEALIVLPSEGSTTDSVRIEKIRNTFSDEVIVHEDKGGKSGIVQPIFKSGKKENYLYVLVPLPKE